MGKATETRSLPEYRAMLETMKGGTVPAELALEIVQAAEDEVRLAHGELTIAQAMERSGKSRSYFERRVQRWAESGMARKPGREWLIRVAVIPSREVQGGFDPSLSANELADALWKAAI